MSVFCKKKGDKLRVYGFVGTEVSAKETAYKFSVYRCVITWEMDVFETSEDALEIFSQLLDLCGLACAVQTFQYYQHIFVLFDVTYLCL